MKPMICLALCLCALPAFAQIDCELGIYFDDGGWIRGIAAAEGSVAHAYLVLAPAAPRQLTSFQQMIDVHNATGVWAETRGGGVNAHVPWGDSDLSLEVAWSVPYLVDGPTVIADLYIPVGAAYPILIFAECWAFGEIVGETGYVGWGHCTYCDEMPPQMTIAANINDGHIPIENEGMSWSAIKKVYR